MATEVADKSVQLILFEAIETALASLLNDKTIRSVEIFNSQTDFENQERPHLYPFVAVNISVEWTGARPTNNKGYTTKLAQPQQQGNALVTVYTIFENIQNETLSYKAAEPIRHCVHRAINQIEDKDYFTPLQRTLSDPDSSHDRVFSLVTNYTTEVTEAAMKDSTKKIATNVDPVLTSDLIIENETIRTAKEFT